MGEVIWSPFTTASCCARVSVSAFLRVVFGVVVFAVEVVCVRVAFAVVALEECRGAFMMVAQRAPD